MPLVFIATLNTLNATAASNAGDEVPSYQATILRPAQKPALLPTGFFLTFIPTPPTRLELLGGRLPAGPQRGGAPLREGGLPRPSRLGGRGWAAAPHRGLYLLLPSSRRRDRHCQGSHVGGGGAEGRLAPRRAGRGGGLSLPKSWDFDRKKAGFNRKGSAPCCSSQTGPVWDVPPSWRRKVVCRVPAAAKALRACVEAVGVWRRQRPQEAPGYSAVLF